MTTDLTQGNRLPVSCDIGDRRHFHYKAVPVYIPQEDIALLVQATKLLLERMGCLEDQLGHVEAFSSLHFRNKPEYAGALDALDRVFATVSGPCVLSGKVDLVACRWVGVHQDEAFRDSSFLSIVLHTGPSPYLMQTLHSEILEQGGSKARTSTSRLNVGDTFIFDPTTTHTAFPAFPHQDSLLILAQVELNDETLTDRRNIIGAFPPLGEKEAYAYLDRR